VSRGRIQYEKEGAGDREGRLSLISLCCVPGAFLSPGVDSVLKEKKEKMLEELRNIPSVHQAQQAEQELRTKINGPRAPHAIWPNGTREMDLVLAPSCQPSLGPAAGAFCPFCALFVYPNCALLFVLAAWCTLYTVGGKDSALVVTLSLHSLLLPQVAATERATQAKAELDAIQGQRKKLTPALEAVRPSAPRSPLQRFQSPHASPSGSDPGRDPEV